MVTIENELLKVVIRSKGAELSSLINKQTETEHIWYADPQVWPWHAPNLFPVVGGCINNEIRVDGTAYPMQRHGFARHSQFMKIEHTDTHAQFSLPYNPDTLKVYPYKFEFQVLYDLFGNKLRVSYKVINRDDKDIYFSVGAHPAFTVPFYTGEKYADYYLEFNNGESLERYILSPEGFFTGETEPVVLQGNKLPLNAELFANDALVFKNLQSREVSIKSDRHEHSLSVSFPHFNYLGIWAKPGAPFVCIEPWLGCADTVNKATDIGNKEAIQKVEHGHVFETEFYIAVS
ncbi:aldose 1-epimerase family protein [Pedobacter sp. BS3]|uniref:aldose 1-epimerase family protein n=1 Tax=Pedobacter sp. BS3 TaxID=2567937 RepID=UPI0011EFC4D5|nr:aldose 1-epimerase family protein [Pedobacter sp. BS3]TZF84672.1 aldose 1-epimerase family protein [Pedobacter sp. BS3]